MPRYPVVLLDVGETLVGPRTSYGAVYREVLARLGLELEEGLLERAIRATAAQIARAIPPGTDRFGQFEGGEQEYWRQFVAKVLRAATGREADAGFVRLSLEGLWEAFGRTSAWRVYDDVRPALDRLRRDDVRLAVVSNWDTRLSRLLDLLDLTGYFEAVGVSHVEGVEKPDPSLFQRVLSRIGAEPSESLHVGNVVELDIQGARAAGIDGVLIDRAGDCAFRGATIRDLRELPRIAAEGLAPA